MLKTTIRKKFFTLLLSGIALFSSIITIYSFTHEKQPNIFIQTSSFNVLDINKNLEELSILFRNEDIQKRDLNLRFYSIRFENTGDIDILQNQYDKNNDWGVSVHDGTLINAQLVKSNSQYILENLQPKAEKNNIVFNKIIFGKEKYFTVEFFVLHNRSKSPQLSAFGKIAGIDSLNIQQLMIKEKESFFESLFHGNLVVNLVRLPLYFIGFLIALLVIMSPFILITVIVDKLKEKKRKKIIVKLRQKSKINNSEEIQFLSNIYINNGLGALISIQKLDRSRIKFYIKYQSAYNHLPHPIIMSNNINTYLIKELMDNNFIQSDYEDFTDDFNKEIDNFIDIILQEDI